MALINVSNRLPVTLGKQIKKSSGGLVSALEGVTKSYDNFLWLGWSGGSVFSEEKQNQLRSQQNVLTDARRDELIGEISALETEIKRRSEDLKKAFNQRLEDFTKRMNAKMAPLFQKFAQDNKYTTILYLNPQVIAYLEPGADVTDTVIALYNQTYPVAAAPATPAKK